MCTHLELYNITSAAISSFISAVLHLHVSFSFSHMQVSQLRHDLSMKDELLQFYTSAAEESEGESTTSTPYVSSQSLPLHTFITTPTLSLLITFYTVSSFRFKIWGNTAAFINMSVCKLSHTNVKKKTLVYFQCASQWTQCVNPNLFPPGLLAEETQRSGGRKQVFAIWGTHTRQSYGGSFHRKSDRQHFCICFREVIDCGDGCLLCVLLISTVCLIFPQASHLETETISYEEKEQQLVNDCVKELREYFTVIILWTKMLLRCSEARKRQLYICWSAVSVLRWCQSADFLPGWRAGQKDWGCLQAAGGDHTPPLPDSRPAEEGQAGMKPLMMVSICSHCVKNM